MCNLKCERCGTWSNDVPLADISEDSVKILTYTVCGKCYHESVWHFDAPVPILIPFETFHGEKAPWTKYKK